MPVPLLTVSLSRSRCAAWCLWGQAIPDTTFAKSLIHFFFLPELLRGWSLTSWPQQISGGGSLLLYSPIMTIVHHKWRQWLNREAFGEKYACSLLTEGRISLSPSHRPINWLKSRSDFRRTRFSLVDWSPKCQSFLMPMSFVAHCCLSIPLPWCVFQSALISLCLLQLNLRYLSSSPPPFAWILASLWLVAVMRWKANFCVFPRFLFPPEHITLYIWLPFSLLLSHLLLETSADKARNCSNKMLMPC